MHSKLKDLTKAEEQVMQHLWELEKGFVKDILARMGEPKPAYNTVSTIVRILEEKGFVDHKAYGKTHEYFPVVSKEEYSKYTAGNLLSNYFNGSVKELVSFFVKEPELNMNDLDDILKSIDKKVWEMMEYMLIGNVTFIGPQRRCRSTTSFSRMRRPSSPMDKITSTACSTKPWIRRSFD